MSKLKTIVVAIFILILCGCATKLNESKANKVELPEWIRKPVPEEALQTVKCVKYNGNLSLNKNTAIMKGRKTLAKKIKNKIKVLDKSYKKKLDEKNTISSIFAARSFPKKFIKHKDNSFHLYTTKEWDISNIDGNKHLCVLVAVDNDFFNKLFRERYSELSFMEKLIFFKKLAPTKAKEILEKESN